MAFHLPAPVLSRIFSLAAEVEGGGEDRLRQQVNERADQPGKQDFEKLVEEVGEEEARRALARAMNEFRWF